MAGMDKRELAAQLVARCREAVGVAEREMHAAAEAARDGADAKTKRDDARMAIEFGGLARAQRARAERARMILSAVETFRPKPLPKGSKIEVGALIELEDEETGHGRTVFLCPAGAGIELTGPGGDGFLSVVTPQSPVGRAAIGLEVGDSIDVTIDGEARSWEITWVA